jgi:hypothetical protein
LTKFWRIINFYYLKSNYSLHKKNDKIKQYIILFDASMLLQKNKESCTFLRYDEEPVGDNSTLHSGDNQGSNQRENHS